MLSSGSALDRDFNCAATAVLPRDKRTTKESIAGNATHEQLEEMADVTTQAAIEELGLSAGCVLGAEHAYVMTAGGFVSRGPVRRRDYGELAADAIPCTLDLSGFDGGVAVVVDWKSGRYLRPAKDSWQLRFGALCVARTHGCDRAKVAIVSLAATGSPFWDVAEFDGFQLDGFEAELKRFVAERTNPAAMEGAEKRANSGPWCRYCPSYLYCPAQTALIRQLATAPGTIEAEVVNALSPETAAKAYERLRAVEMACNTMRNALYSYAQQFPIDLGNGRVFGLNVTKRESLDGETVFEVVAQAHGAGVARKAVELKATKAALGRALPAAEVKRLLEEVRKRGGTSTKTSETVSEHAATRDGAL